jgi:hypothetical protein
LIGYGKFVQLPLMLGFPKALRLVYVANTYGEFNLAIAMTRYQALSVMGEFGGSAMRTLEARPCGQT